MELFIKVGERLKEIRKSNNLSQEELALQTGLDRTYICSVENGKRNISIKNLNVLCNTLQISLSDFFKDIL